MFDGNDQDFVKHRAKEEINDPKLGQVAQVYEHISEDDNSNFECDVLIDGNLFEERGIPYMGSHSNQISAPMVGETVLIVFRDSENSRPILLGTGYTNKNRPPLARAGMYRDVYESQGSPSGTGNINITGYTKYSNNPARVDKSEIYPTETWYQIAKDDTTPNPSDPSTASMVMEMYDSIVSEKDKSHIKLRGNEVDQDESKSLDITLDFKEGTAEVKAENSTGDFGLSIDVNTGEFTLIDQNGYGIESDGNGNFTWHHNSIDMSEGTTTTL